MKLRISSYELWEKITFTIITAFMLYTIWYQDTHGTINGAFTAMGLTFIVLVVLNLRNISFYWELYGLIAFTVVVTLETIFTSHYRTASFQALVQCFKYILPMIVMFLYMDGNIKKTNKLLWSVWLSVLLLSIGSFLHPSVRNTGAITVGGLNTNTFSSFETLGLMCGMILLFQKKTNKIMRLILLGGVIVDGFAQIQAASRRGFIVYVFIICFVAWEAVRIKYKNKPITKILLICLLAICGVMLVNVFFEKFADTPMVARLLGKANTKSGDLLRAKYQAAAWKLFLANPIFGAGLNSVEQVVGVYSHSLYFELLGCTGIIGTAVLLGFLLSNTYFFFSCLRETANWHDREIAYMSMNGLVFCLSILIMGYAVVLIYDVFFYIMIGLIASMRRYIGNALHTTEKFRKAFAI